MTAGVGLDILCRSYHSFDLFHIRAVVLATSTTSNLLVDKHFKTLAWVHSLQMLLEVIESRPLFLVLWATLSEALKLLTLAMFWLNLVNTLLMSFKVVDGCEALRPWTTMFHAYMLFVVSSCMFSIGKCQRCSVRGLGTSYLKSDWVLLT